MTVYGRNSIEEALEEKLKISALYIDITKKQKFEKLTERLKNIGVFPQWKDTRAMDKIAKTRKHQGIAAEINLPHNIVEEFEGEFDFKTFPKILSLDGITDVMNLGAIIRSALLFDIDAVVLPQDASARITPAVIRASAGAVYHQPVFYIKNLNYFIDELHEAGGCAYGLADSPESETLETLELSLPFCIVIGSERKGMRKSVRKKCDSIVRIPTTGKLDSLNASVAAAITLWEVYKKNI